MKLKPERLIKIRESLGLNKAEAAKSLNMTAMGYGRYESGQRSPSYQTICFIAQVFNTSPEYLCGETNNSTPDKIVLDKNNSPELFELVLSLQNKDDIVKRILAYYKLLSDK
jgi:transcriptional regulator with XRE-family HTH domain